ncbi:MAG: T9SS type A sorting domain-containing protein, partial [Saprospiraceae bacterium]
VAGSVGEVNYQWNTGDSIPDLQNLAPATYTVTVSDFRNCRDTASFVVEQPDTVLVQQAIVPSADSNGVIDLTVTGGIQPYSFIWETGDTTEDINNLIPYTYDVSVTDANNCLHKVAVDVYPADMCVDTILQAESGILNGIGIDTWNERWALGDGFIYLKDDTTETATFHLDIPADGFYTIGFRYADKWASREATIMIDNQIEFLEFAFPRTFDWANWEKIEFVDYLTAGTHTLTVAHHIDNWGPWIDFISVCNQVVVPISLDAAVTDNICYGDSAGALTVLPTGGTRNYTYLWNTGDTTETITNLLSGDYYITVTDEVGQMTIDTFNVGQPTEITPSFVIKEVKCKGESNGRGTVTVTGGTSGYSYQWSHGPTWRSTYNVPAGIYTLSVTDANGCLKATDITINEPDTLEATFINTVSSGLDGTIDMTPFGGNAPYTYYWKKDSILTQDRSGLAVGYYKVTITDTLGCKLKTGTSVYPAGICMDTIMEAEEGLYTNIGYNIWYSDSITGRGYIYFTADTSGIASYTFDVQNDGYYAIGFRYADKFTDRKESILIDGVMEHLDFTFPRTYDWKIYEFIDFTKYLTAGTHTLDIKHRDSWGPRIDFITVCDIALKGDVISTNINCNGDSTGTITTNITGGREPYLYTWNTGDTTPSLNNLPIGTYILTVTDTLNQVFTDTIDIIQPLPLIANITANDVSCNGAIDGQASVNTLGGNGNYTFLWNTNDTTNTINNLNIGSYNVVVTDELGCSTTTSTSISQPSVLSASINSVTHLSCNGNATGSTSVLATGGNSSYSYLWNNGDTTATINNLNAGNYIVTITDNKGCQDITNTTITEPSLVISNLVSSHDVTCNGDNNGQINMAASGGTGALSYLWNNGDTTATINNLNAGNYTLTVTDQLGCIDTISAAIVEPSVLTLNFSNINSIDCYGNTNGNIHLVANGGNFNYQYNWSNGDTTDIINNLQAGNYIVTLTDALGCSVIDSATIIEPSLLTLTYAVTPSTGNDGIINLTPLGGSPTYIYNWSDGNTNKDRTALTVKNYHVTITDNNGCSITEKFSIYDSNTCLDDVYQAENALVANGSTIHLSDTTGALGDGFVEFGSNTTETLTFSVNPTIDTIYEIGIRYSQGNSDEPLEVLIDGNQVYSNLVFSKTINWNTWNYITFKEHFTAGTHSIQFKNISANGPDIDYLSLCVTSPDTIISNYNIAHRSDQPTLVPYPNPASNHLNLDIQLFNAPQGIITIFDVNGRMMHQYTITNKGKNIIQQQIAINDYAEGLYFVQLKTEKGSIVKKITVIK